MTNGAPVSTHKPVIVQGDSLEVLKKIASNSIDLLCTDPPYGYHFLGNDWDKATPSVAVWNECLRVLKPGAFAFVMAAPRSDVFLRVIGRLEDAGFRIDFTPIYWTYASGFPKALNIGKKCKVLNGSFAGFQPKPAVEVVAVAMKPLSEVSFTSQALANRKGITWLGDVRIPCSDKSAFPLGPRHSPGLFGLSTAKTEDPNTNSRFPANLLVSDEALNDGSTYFSLDRWAETLPFLWVPKPNATEKNRGLGIPNTHPTVKPLRLMSYLISLGSRPDDLVLDPYVGSGTTAVASIQLGRRCFGIERDPEYFKVARARVAIACKNS